jgi:hypothetical protein
LTKSAAHRLTTTPWDLVKVWPAPTQGGAGEKLLGSLFQKAPMISTVALAQ